MKRSQTMMTMLAMAMLCAAPLALAQSTSAQQMQHPQSGAMTHTPPYQSTQPQPQSTMPSSSTGQVMGEHTMPATVKSVTSQGLVDVVSEGMTLRLHFPNAAQNLKTGDKITLHLGYTKDSSSSSM